METDLARQCRNCGTDLQGDFCHDCGQKNINDKSLSYILGQFMGALYFVDSKLIRSLRHFFFKPGFLSREFIDGRKVRYMSPISLFFIFNVLYFFFNSATDFNLSLIDQISLQPYSPWAKELIDRLILDRGISYRDFEVAYTAESSNLSKTLIILNIPVLAIFVLLLNIRRKYFFIDHFIYATYLMAFILFGFSFLFRLSFYTSAFIDHYFSHEATHWFDTFFQITLLVIYLLYVFVSFRRTYQTGWASAVLASIVMAGGFVAVNYYYRFLLFVATYWSLS